MRFFHRRKAGIGAKQPVQAVLIYDTARHELDEAALHPVRDSQAHGGVPQVPRFLDGQLEDQEGAEESLEETEETRIFPMKGFVYPVPKTDKKS